MSQTEVQLIKDAVIVNADVSNSAAIDVSKISGAMPLAGGTFTDDVTFTGANYNVVWDKSDNALEFADSAKSIFGTGGDLEVYHDGSNSYVKAVSGGTGSLYIFADGKNIFLRPKSGEDGIKVIPDGAVELYHNGTKELETTSNGIDVFSDNAIVNIVSNGSGTSTSFIQFRGYRIVGDVGRLGEMQFINQRDGDVQAEIEVIANGDTNSYFDFKTSNAGLRTLRVDHSGANFPDNIKARFGAGEDLQLYHDGTHSYIYSQNGELKNRAAIWKAVNAANSEKMIEATENGSVDLYYDDSKKFETSSTGNLSTGVHKFVTGSGSTASDDNVLHIVAGGTSNRGIMIGTGRASAASQNDGMGFIDAINSESNGYGSQLQFRIDGTAAVTIGNQSNDYVGIGETVPLAPLHIKPASNVTQLLIEQNNATDGYGLFQDGPNGGHLKFMRHINGSETQKLLLRSDGGLCFGTDSAAANALDDYEEGTWTPSVQNGGGTINQVYKATYTKIGRLVHVQCYIDYSAGSSSSAFQMGGLPFTVQTDGYSPQITDFGRGGKKGAYSRTHTNNTYLEFLYSSESTSSDRITIKGNQIGSSYIILATTYMT